MFFNKLFIITTSILTVSFHSVKASDSKSDILPLEAPHPPLVTKTEKINSEEFNKFIESQKDSDSFKEYPVYKQVIDPKRKSQSFGNSIGREIDNETGEEKIGGLDFLRELNNWKEEEDKKSKTKKKKEKRKSKCCVM